MATRRRETVTKCLVEATLGATVGCWALAFHALAWLIWAVAAWTIVAKGLLQTLAQVAWGKVHPKDRAVLRRLPRQVLATLPVLWVAIDRTSNWLGDRMDSVIFDVTEAIDRIRVALWRAA